MLGINRCYLDNMGALTMTEDAVRMTRMHQRISQYYQAFQGTMRKFRSITETT